MQIRKNHDHELIQPVTELFAIHETFQLQEHRATSPHNQEMNLELKIDTEPQRFILIPPWGGGGGTFHSF